MKIHIPAPIMQEMRKLIARARSALRILMPQRQRRLVADKRHRQAFRLRKASFKGHGLRAELQGSESDRVREIAYQRRS